MKLVVVFILFSTVVFAGGGSLFLRATVPPVLRLNVNQYGQVRIIQNTTKAAPKPQVKITESEENRLVTIIAP